MPECPPTAVHKRRIEENAPLIGRIIPIHAVCFAVNQLLPIKDAGSELIHFGCALGLASTAVAGDLHQYKLASYPDGDSVDFRSFSDGAIDSHDDFCASLCRDFDTLCDLRHLTNFAVLEASNGSLVCLCRI